MARFALVFAALLSTAAVSAEPEQAAESAPQVATAASEPAAASGNSMDESGAFAVQPKGGVVVDEVDLNATTP